MGFTPARKSYFIPLNMPALTVIFIYATVNQREQNSDNFKISAPLIIIFTFFDN